MMVKDFTYLSEKRSDVFAVYGKSEEDVKEYVLILREWMKKQPHIPSEHLSDELLEIHILKNKFSVESAKVKIENYCTMKNKPRTRYLFENYSLSPAEQSYFKLPMPCLTEDFDRVYITKCLDEDKFDTKSALTSELVLKEITSRFDFSIREIHIVDMSLCSMKMLTKLRANIMADGVQTILNSHSARIKGLHIITKHGSALMNWIKPFLPVKIASRLFVHDDPNVVPKLVSARYLPKDYGGDLKSLRDILVEFGEIFKDNTEKIVEYINTSSREELRQGGPLTEEMHEFYEAHQCATSSRSVLIKQFSVMDITYLSDRRKDVLAFCGKNEQDMKDIIVILREWMLKQPHIPSELLSDEALEIHIIKNKFLIEKVKTKIESYCSMKNKPQTKYFFENYSLTPSREAQFYIPMPLLTESFQRIFIGKIWDEESYDLKSVFTNLLILREIMSRHDYSVEEIFIMDMSHSSMKFITKFRANIMADGVPLVLKCYSARIKQIHLISKFASTIMNWMKPILPSKIASRFRAHESVETLSEHIGAKYLPKDYGGDLKSLKEHLVDFDEIYAKHKDQIIGYVKTSAREELRQGEPAPEDMQGTFLKLNID
ncbi:hypothetical protein WA026_021808 [Henosepilachna vigintioctopunctata]|uniref:CRAL-TRIO domain-containing protein n=1 Tax=Henosepilachna vigintioctopunctata TaxID=420089 RepID=A0AAW1TYX1_9CUCU